MTAEQYKAANLKTLNSKTCPSMRNILNAFIFCWSVCLCVCTWQREDEWMLKSVPLPLATATRGLHLGHLLYPYKESKDKTKACIVLKYQYIGTPITNTWKNLHRNTTIPSHLPFFFPFIINYRLCYVFYTSFLWVSHIQTGFFLLHVTVKIFYLCVFNIKKHSSHS